MNNTKLSLGEIDDMLYEYVSNEVALYVILHNSDSYQTEIAINKLHDRQREIHGLVLIACGLEYEDEEQQ